MASKTVHVFCSQGTWQVKREGASGKAYGTKREAVAAARKTMNSMRAGQFVVHGKDGLIKEHGTHNMTPVQDPPKKSSRASEIARAVSQVVLDRLQSNSTRERAPQA